MSNMNNEEIGLTNKESSSVVQLLALSELGSTDPASTAPAILDSINPLHQIKTRLTVNVGEIELTVGELLNARENQILKLDRSVEQAVDLLLEGKLVARGLLVAAGDNFAVKITELPISLKV
ncbi:FliM/FliN family flagellar motor switch protein [Herbaspirillum autotrophicum]|uniref:FliM/FliN family flagellar motor switch protein n=1 Tax=Herbaspirillum autotrophicum TaxID=180195 RepID=UPI001E3A8526|nr:FliM/FliN family flagellar motor C-terminal domain-containing protein [Herbaspirillum autotrophicum]